MTRVALDSNILLYAELEPASSKGRRAIDVIKRADLDGVIPVQALAECLRVIQRRRPQLLTAAVRQMGIYASIFSTPETTRDTVEAAAEMALDHGIQLWDAVIIVAAQRAGAEVLFTEDLQDGQSLGGIRIINPFEPANDEAVSAILGAGLQ